MWIPLLVWQSSIRIVNWDIKYVLLCVPSLASQHWLIKCHWQVWLLVPSINLRPVAMEMCWSSLPVAICFPREMCRFRGNLSPSRQSGIHRRTVVKNILSREPNWFPVRHLEWGTVSEAHGLDSQRSLKGNKKSHKGLKTLLQSELRHSPCIN